MTLINGASWTGTGQNVKTVGERKRMDKCALCGHDKAEHYSPIGCRHEADGKLCDCVWGSILEQRFRVIDDWVYYPSLLRREDYLLISAAS